jgi:FAD/FMN-containing dehydrogenase
VPALKEPDLQAIARELNGALHTDSLYRRAYATDASAYQELPLAVAVPASEADLVSLIRFARKHQLGLIPRTAGTSLAGQVVGTGIVVDVSKSFTRILEINTSEQRVRCEPGVIRNELNLAMKPHGLLFGPEASTQNRKLQIGSIQYLCH